MLNGAIMDEWDARGKHVQDDVVLLLLNAYHEPIAFTLPGLTDATPWEVLADTANPAAEAQSLRPGTAFDLQGRSLTVLRQRIAPASDVTA
jgi:isoamylase